MTNSVGAFSRGLMSIFQAVRFLQQHRRLLKFVFIPLCINMAVFSVAAYLGLAFFESYVMHRIPQAEAWYWFLLNYLLWIIAILFTAVLTFFSFSIIGNLIASPFNDILSEKTEEILAGGQPVSEPFKFKAFFQDAGRIMLDEARKMLLFVSAMALLLFVNLLPGVGSLLYALLSALLTIFFLTVEYTGYVFSRHRLPFKEQRRFIFANAFLLAGFGLGLLCMFAIPFFQFLCIPLGVIAAARLCHEANWPALVEGR